MQPARRRSFSLGRRKRDSRNEWKTGGNTKAPANRGGSFIPYLPGAKGRSQTGDTWIFSPKKTNNYCPSLSIRPVVPRSSLALCPPLSTAVRPNWCTPTVGCHKGPFRLVFTLSSTGPQSHRLASLWPGLFVARAFRLLALEEVRRPRKAASMTLSSPNKRRPSSTFGHWPQTHVPTCRDGCAAGSGRRRPRSSSLLRRRCDAIRHTFPHRWQ